MIRCLPLLTSLMLLVAVYHPVECCYNGSSAVGDCLHTYLERDFPSIEAIVFPKKKGDRGNKNYLLLDGPELEDQCHRIGEVVECLEALQPTCRLYIQFFPFRHLVSCLRKTIDWVCHDLRGRFRILLDNFNCLETARRKAISLPGQPCYNSKIPVNIWQRIVRQQSGPEVCQTLVTSTNCTRGYIQNNSDCPVEAQLVYQELHQIFLKAWCSPTLLAAKSTASQTGKSWIGSSNICLLLIPALLVIKVSLRFIF